jgi:hypothetical protein
MKRFLLLLLSITPVLLHAQELTGIWQGHFVSDDEGKQSSSTNEDRYRFEVQIAQRGKTLEAVTYSYLSTIFYGKAAASGTINVHTGKVLIQEGKLLELRNSFGGVCMMTCFLQYFKYGGEEFLEGKFVSMTLKDSTNCGRGKVLLRRKTFSDFPEEPFLVEREKELKAAPPIAAAPPVKKPSVAGAGTPHRPDSTQSTAKTPSHVTHHPDSTRLTASTLPPVVHHHHPTPPPPTTPPPPPPVARISVPKGTLQTTSGDSMVSMNRHFPTVVPRVLVDRSTILVRSLTVHTKEVVLNIYDDGAIDNDTISVYLDNRRVLDHAMLTDRPLIVTLHLDDSNDFHELVLVADNEGTIPPNTSLMIVKAGDKEYKVNITSSLQKNATITFKYVKPD